MPKQVLEQILGFCASHRLVLMADEVYQENVYGDAPKFFSFKKALMELKVTDGEPAAAGDAREAAHEGVDAVGAVGATRV